MKYSNLLMSSLLVSTALSTAASAATVSLSGDITAINTALAVRSISTQAFPAVASIATATGTNRLFIRFGQFTNSAFTASVNVTGAKFVTAGVSTSARAAQFVAGTVAISPSINLASTAACTVLAGASTLLLTCDTTAVGGLVVSSSSINGVVISGIAFDNISALSTAGTSVSLDFSMLVGGVTFDSAAATAVITSRTSITATSASAGTAPAKIASQNATGAFLKLVGPVTTATIGSLFFTKGTGDTYAQDLSTALTGASIAAGAELKVTSSIFSDDATTKTQFISSGDDFSVTSTQFGAGFVTFSIPAADIAPATNAFIEVHFNGTKEIDVASAGTTLLTYVSAAGAGSVTNIIAPAAVSGTVSALSRDGLAIDLNGVQPGTAQGARQYTSLVRVSNTGISAGTVTIVVSNETTGAVLGTYTSASVPVGASLQVSSAQIEAGAGITPSASVLYRLAISGNITGYAQHVTWNQDAGFFGDLSARRDTTTGTNN